MNMEWINRRKHPELVRQEQLLQSAVNYTAGGIVGLGRAVEHASTTGGPMDYCPMCGATYNPDPNKNFCVNDGTRLYHGDLASFQDRLNALKVHRTSNLETMLEETRYQLKHG